MHFEVEQRFTAAADAVIRLYADAAFYDRLQGLPKIGRPVVLDRIEATDQVTLRVQYRFTGDLPSAARAFIEPDKLTWVEETVYDLARATSRSRLIADHYADRFTASATSAFTRDPSDPSSSRRRVEGDVKVRVPLVGGKVEAAIVSGLQDHLDDEARVADDALAS
jgi:hypothetical protein